MYLLQVISSKVIMKILGFVLLLVFTAVFAEDVPVKTDVGTFIGFTDEIEIDGTAFRLSKFLGIPYAEAPVGDLRFRKPVPKSPMTEKLPTKTLRSACMQVMAIPKPQQGSEDCLFLNVYSPAGEKPLPVMIWIHGGAFVLGSANSVNPVRLAANGPVIVVTINYRLSIWGFLSTEDSNSPGNYGLWDQHLAIKWVHDNIDKFGGDPNRITIFGESAGSASVIYQGWYPGNRGLFQRIIGQSGSPFAGWASAHAPLKAAEEFAALAGCDTDNSKQMVDCLRQLDNRVINDTLNNEFGTFGFRSITFIPFPDNDFVSECSTESGQKYSACRSVFSSFDYLTGITSGEGYIFTPPSPFLIEEQAKFQPNRTFFENTLIPQIVSSVTSEPSDVLANLITAEYTDWNNPDDPEIIREQFLDIMGDMFFLAPMLRTIQQHVELTDKPSSYMYYLTMNPSTHALPTPGWASKPNHADDLIYVFGGECDMSEYGTAEVPELDAGEKLFAYNMMTLWTNFAKTGNPNKPRDLGIDWLPYTNKHGHYLDMSQIMTATNVKTRLRDRKVNFWTKIAPAVMSQCKVKSTAASGTCEVNGQCEP